MNFLRNLAVSLFSFFLFLALGVFGIAFAVKSTALNPDFVTTELNRLDMPALVEEFVRIENPPDMPDLDKTIHRAISELEPEIKAQSDSAIRSVYDYLLGGTAELNLALILRQTFLSTDFVTPLVDSIEISPLAADFISQEYAQAIPIEIQDLDKYIENVLKDHEPALKQQIVTISGPVFDYLLGLSPTLNTSVSLEQVRDDLKDDLLLVFLDSPPAELAGLSRQQREDYFNQFYQQFAGDIPTTYPIDESLISARLRADIIDGISSAEDSLIEVKQYVAYFQQGYILSLVFMGLMALGIILLVRNIKDIAHRLGVPLVTYGALEYAGIWVTRYLISSDRFQFSEVPIQLQDWLVQFINNILRPLEIFSLALLIIGAALIVASFLYKRNQDLAWT